MIANAPQEKLDSHDLGALCAQQLGNEETLLAAALPLVRAAQGAFPRRDLESFVAALAVHQEAAGLMDEMNFKRQRFRADLAAHLHVKPQEVTWAGALAALPNAAQTALAIRVAQVRRLGAELAAASHTLSVQLRIYLDAYRRLLRDLTNTSAGSGRYGPAGTAESYEYRSLIHING